MNAPGLQIEMLAKGKARVNIYGDIGPSWAGMVDTQMVSEALSSAGQVDEIEVRINSRGGSAYDGIGIYNVLKSHPAKVNVKIDGVAASAASIIAMAGDTIEMPKNALMMVHNPRAVVAGKEEELRSAADGMAKMKAAGVETYAAKTNKSAEEITAWMDKEMWFSGDEAVAVGLADRTGQEVSLPKVEQAAMQPMFSNAPNQFASLLALSMRASKEETMTETNPVVQPVVPAVVPAVPVITQADVTAAAEAARKEAVLSERKRAADITALCSQAGKPEMAAGFLEDANMSVTDVQAKLFHVICQERKPADGGPAPPVVQNDENSAYRQEYAAKKAVYMQSGLSEADYIATRRIDDGLDTLTFKAA